MDSNATVTFELENHQLEQIPLEAVVQSTSAIEAFVKFYETNELTPLIEWQ